jgi:predicted dehydrogenase
MTPPRNNFDPLRIALIGCGQIADAHLHELAKIKNVRVVAVCDMHRDLAMQAAARFGIDGVYDSIPNMLAQSRPDVVHIATPAHTHFSVARDCLNAGCHIYVEKPFTLNADEAEALVDLAADRSLNVCVGHDQLFDPIWLELRRRVAGGEIGPMRHVESVLGYPISGQFGSQVAADPNHWVRRLPGGLFQNTISHPLYRITEFLTDGSPEVSATWHTRQGRDFPTELFVQLHGTDVTGTLSFVSTIAPQRITRVYGERGALEVDLDGQIIRCIGPAKAAGAFCKLLTPWKHWREAACNLRDNLWRFLKADIHYFAGLRGLSNAFYDSIRTGKESPIPATEIVRVTRIMDQIFETARSTPVADIVEPSRGSLRKAPLMEALS